MKKSFNSKNIEKSMSDKIIMYSSIGVLVLVAILVSLLAYSKQLSDEVKNETMSLNQIASISENTSTDNSNESVNDNNTNTESASTDIGKSIEEVEKENNTQNAGNIISTLNTTTSSKSSSYTTNEQNNKNSQTNVNSNTNNSNTSSTNESNNSQNDTVNTSSNEEKVELNFAMPVEGEIVREFAKENLIFSETLQEWTTHNGVDIKADKTTVVKAAEAGTVKSIKNDPRYGLTVVIDHGNNFQTVYSNLLTSEFVIEGEKIEKGQSIGTVGNTAVFEIADEPHLHFEILKDSIQIDPNIYLK